MFNSHPSVVNQPVPVASSAVPSSDQYGRIHIAEAYNETSLVAHLDETPDQASLREGSYGQTTLVLE